MQVLLGILIGLACSTVGNLLTAGTRRPWATERDFYLYLFQWLSATIASSVAAAACFLVVSTHLTGYQAPLLTAGVVFSVVAVGCCLVMVWCCRDFTATSMKKTPAAFRSDIANVTATRPAAEGAEQAPRGALLALVPAPGTTVDLADDHIGAEQGLTLETFAAEMKAAAKRRQPTTSKP
jgi:hypothetical protein